MQVLRRNRASTRYDSLQSKRLLYFNNTKFLQIISKRAFTKGIARYIFPFLAITGDQTLSLKKHIEGYAYGSPPDVVRFRDTANGRSFSADATPFDALASRGTTNVENFTSSTLRFNGENVQYAADSHRPYNAKHSPVFHPSYIPIGSDVFPTSDIIYQWPSSIAAASNISATENEADADHLFKKYTCQGDDSSDECQVSGFGAPKASSVSLQHTPETLEPCAAEAIKMQPVGDAGSEERFQPQEMDYQQTTPNVFSAASDPHEKGKKPKTRKERKPRIKKEKKERTKANPDRIRKSYSSRRRHNPTSRYWCADPTCKASENRSFRGFRTTEDTRRHLALHEPPKMFCKLPHKEGVIEYEGRRTDHLRE